jgi:hypothetical protein
VASNVINLMDALFASLISMGKAEPAARPAKSGKEGCEAETQGGLIALRKERPAYAARQ